jgi:hypothetical protein
MQPKKFTFDINGDGIVDVWEVAFMENPMFITPGGRIRYQNGVTLFCCVPLLLSQNVGSDMTMKSENAIHENFPLESARGITMGFDPWYTKWKIVAAISFPLIFRQTSAEMIRNFTLLKNQKSATRIDIDERLKAMNSGAPIDTVAQEQKDNKRRLDEIKKAREQIDKEAK